MSFTLQILGCSSALPTLERHTSCQLLNINSNFSLIDCGENAQLQLLRYKLKAQKINQIFISHLHGDHCFGLMGLLSSMSLQGRIDPVHLFAPKGLDEIITLSLQYSGSVLRMPVEFHALDTTQHKQIFDNEDFTVHSIPLIHGVPCCGFLFREKRRKRKILKEKVPPNLPIELLVALKDGHDIVWGGRKISNNELTTDPKPAISYAYCSDTAYSETVAKLVQGVHLLYHEATFTQLMAERATETYHSTAQQAATIAAKAQVKKLLLGHFSARYTLLDGFLDEAKPIFAKTLLAHDGMKIDLENL